MIYKSINCASQFADEFIRAKRKDNFSYGALEALYTWYEDIGEDINLDVISICCQWTEYSIKKFMEQYNYQGQNNLEELIEELRDKTTVIELDESILMMNY